MTLENRRRLNSLLAEHALATRQVKVEKEALQEAKAKVEDATRAQQLVQTVAEEVQNQAHRQIASVVTRCLQNVFGDEAYQFRVRFVQKRGKTEAELVFARDGKEIDPMDAAGGGVIDVCAFALRLACLVLARPKRRRLLVLDEPFRFVSREFIPAVRQLLESLAKEMELQIIAVTHNQGLCCGKVVEL